VGCPLPNLYPLYSPRPHLPSFFWSGLKGRSHLLLSCCCGPSSLCKGMVSWGAAPQKLRPPLPHRYSPLPSRSREATHLSLGMAQDLGLELRPGRTTSKHRGEHGPQRGPESSSSSRAPLPPPARAAAAGASWARRPAGKMADGPGWLVTRRRRQQPATLGPNLRLGMEAQPPFKRTPRSITVLGAGAASVSLSTPTPDPSLTATPAGAPRADTSGDRVTRPRPTPTRARSGLVGPGPDAWESWESRESRESRQPVPEAVSAAGRRARAGRRPTASGKQEAGGGGRARGAGGIRACPLHRAGCRAGCSCARLRAGHLKIPARGTGPVPPSRPAPRAASPSAAAAGPGPAPSPRGPARSSGGGVASRGACSFTGVACTKGVGLDVRACAPGAGCGRGRRGLRGAGRGRVVWRARLRGGLADAGESWRERLKDSERAGPGGAAWAAQVECQQGRSQ
jgi:hypothetical protein